MAILRMPKKVKAAVSKGILRSTQNPYTVAYLYLLYEDTRKRYPLLSLTVSYALLVTEESGHNILKKPKLIVIELEPTVVNAHMYTPGAIREFVPAT